MLVLFSRKCLSRRAGERTSRSVSLPASSLRHGVKATSFRTSGAEVPSHRCRQLREQLSHWVANETSRLTQTEFKNCDLLNRLRAANVPQDCRFPNATCAALQFTPNRGLRRFHISELEVFSTWRIRLNLRYSQFHTMPLTQNEHRSATGLFTS